MSSTRVIWIDLETFAHATEEPENVFKALSFLLPEGGEKVVNRETVQGHYRNTIIIYKAKLSDKKTIEWFLRMLSERMNDEDKKRLYHLFDMRLDDSGILYLRFDKQEAFLGRLKLSESEDVIRVRIRFSAYPISKELIEKVCLDLGLMIK